MSSRAAKKRKRLGSSLNAKDIDTRIENVRGSSAVFIATWTVAGNRHAMAYTDFGEAQRCLNMHPDCIIETYVAVSRIREVAKDLNIAEVNDFFVSSLFL